MKSDNGKWTIAKKAWAPLLGVLVVGGLCYSLKLEGASVPGNANAKDRAVAKEDPSLSPISISRTVRDSGSAGRVSIGKVPKTEYPIAPPVLVDPFNDEGDAYRRRTGATGPIPLPQVGGGAIAAVACSFKSDCDDGNPCTNDLCDIGPGAGAGTGTCKNDPIENGQAGDCDDGVFCNGLELCQGAAIFHCLGTCSGGPNNGLPCATDAANADNCPNGTCNLKKCVGGPNNNAVCTYDSSCTTVFGTCSNPGNPCSGGTPTCNEGWDNPNDAIPATSGGSCQTTCASDADCADPTATAATNGCTLDYCCIGGNYTRKSCVGGANSGLICDANSQCPSSTCGNPVSVPCDVSGVCVRGNPCGPAGSCTPRFCNGGGPTFNLQPCVTNNDCGTGGGQGICTDGTLCQGGRCCVTGNCERRPYRTCTGAIGARKWFPGDFGRVDGSGTICPAGVSCPKYGAGVGELGAFTVVAGPTTLSPFNNLMSGAPLRKLGDDYDFGPVPALITITDMRFVGGVDNISNSRTSFEFYDENGVFVQDIFFITSVNVIAVQNVQFDANQIPFDIPAKGYVVGHVLQAFAAPDINSPGEFFWLATDVVDHGTNDAANLYVDTDLNGNPVVTANFLKACVGGVRKGAPCSVNANCPGSTCGSVPGILAFELEGPTQVTPPNGACCDGLGACTQELSWECIGSGSTFLGVGQACNQCSDDSPNVGANCTVNTDCSFCVGGSNDGLACPANPCPGGACLGTCVPACGMGACCATNGNCTLEPNSGACVGTFQGFGSTCVPNCCDQPLASYTGADKCESVIVHNFVLPSPGQETTITITGDNSTASSKQHCVGGGNNGALCLFDANCPGGLCVDDDSCYPPSVPGAELGWFEAFSINGCAYVRVDHCCTDTNPGTPTINDPKIPSYRILYDNCPCGQTVFAKRDPALPDETADARGAPYCAEDNAWGKYGPLRAGTYYYPILSFLGGNFGKYQLHITAKTCPLAACCHNICPSVSGPACTTNADCVQPNGEVCINGLCQELCEKDSDCSAGQCNSTCELLNILDCQDIGGAFLAPPNRGTAVTFCAGSCNTGSCCTGAGVCVDEFPGGDPTLTIDDCDTLNGTYVGGFKCFGGTCNGGTRDGLSCQVDDQCPSGTCGGDTQALGQPTPCPVCDIAGADNCQFFDDSVGTRNSDLTLPGGSRAADDFVPNGTTVSTVCAWGEYTKGDAQGNNVDCSSEVQDNFIVVIYNSDPLTGLPSTVKGTSNVTGANVAKAHQVPTTFEDLQQTKVFAYKLTLDAAIGGMTPGQTYWLEVNNNTNNPGGQNPNCLWNWMAVDFVYNDYSAAGADPATGNDYGLGAGRTSDFAWCVDVSISPAAAPERACCECNGTCSNKTKRDCDNAGNAWHVDKVCQSFSCPGGSPPSDNCANVVVGSSVGEGVYVWDNHCTSTDGPNPIPDELGSASMASDIWIKFVSNCPANSDITFSTCPSGTANGGGIDTFIAVYHNNATPNVCECPTPGNQAALLWPNGLANDEGCTGFLAGGGGVIVTDPNSALDNVNPGNCFMVRLGGFAGQGSEEGSGTAVIQCVPNIISVDPLTKGADDKCVGGANAGLACAQDSDCPGGSCLLKNRFITAVVPATATASGIKVTLVALDANSVATPANYNGTNRWLGAPLINVSDGTSPSFNAAKTQCTFASTNWSAVGQLHMYGDIIVPLSSYDVSNCTASGGPCSAALRVLTTKFGNVIAPSPTVNFQDISSVVAKFSNLVGSPSKTRAKLREQPAGGVDPTTSVNFLEVQTDVSAFGGKTYKQVFATPPATCP